MTIEAITVRANANFAPLGMAYREVRQVVPTDDVQLWISKGWLTQIDETATEPDEPRDYTVPPARNARTEEWREWADEVGIAHDDAMGREDIIEAAAAEGLLD
jgi:hypothetical protein